MFEKADFSVVFFKRIPSSIFWCRIYISPKFSASKPECFLSIYDVLARGKKHKVVFFLLETGIVIMHRRGCNEFFYRCRYKAIVNFMY